MTAKNGGNNVILMYSTWSQGSVNVQWPNMVTTASRMLKTAKHKQMTNEKTANPSNGKALILVVVIQLVWMENIVWSDGFCGIQYYYQQHVFMYSSRKSWFFRFQPFDFIESKLNWHTHTHTLTHTQGEVTEWRIDTSLGLLNRSKTAVKWTEAQQ